MKNEEKDNLFEEHIRKIKYRVGYKINETPRYRSLVNDNEEFDSVPDSLYATKDGQPVPTSQGITNEAGEQEDAPKPGGGEVPSAPSNMDTPANTNAPAPVPAFASGDTATDQIAGGTPMSPIEPVEKVDDIQNDIIKHNIEAMKSIHDKLENLDSTVQGLNSKLDTLNADVEEVREPTNAEKLMSKKNVSYPYYFNLNDFWKGNWFEEKHKDEVENGIRKLPDGTFVADFDDLPQESKTEVQDSFNQIT